MLDNIADLLLTVGLLSGIFGFPTSFAIIHMVPGTAIGVFVGDMIFFFMALSLARRMGRNDVTALPLGLDTPSTFGMVFFVLGPAFLEARETMSVNQAATYTWYVGICAIFISGLFKLACALGSGWIRQVLPRAGLLGSLTAIALVLITFLPLIEVLHYPVAGFVAFAIILTTLVARVRLPARVPGALGALLVGATIFYLMKWTGTLDHQTPLEFSPREALFPHDWLTVFRFEWVSVMKDSLKYLPVVIPFALATVVGGIDCTESAAAVGDEYDTKKVIAAEGVATIVASICGGVIQTTPYIGHPAYKAMGGRSAYTLATALFVGGAGVLGYFGYLYAIIPKVVVFPILIFIGLEITAQSFQATPKRHYPAVALACIPAMAALVLIYVDKIFGGLAGITYFNDATAETVAVSPASLTGSLQQELLLVRVLANGFIVTSLLWASALAAMIDKRLWLAAIYFAIAAIFSTFGLIHSPLPGSPLFFPWALSDAMIDVPVRFGSGYLAVAVLLFFWGWWQRVSE